MRIFRYRTILLILIALVLTCVPLFVWAQDLGVNYAANTDLVNGGGTDLRVLLVNIVRYLLTFLALVAVVVIMYGGWLWMTSNGNPTTVEKAKKTLIGAVIGLVIIISAFAIVTWIINITNSGLGGACSPACANGEACCSGSCCPVGWNCCGGVCQAAPCSNFIPGAGVFQTSAYTPPDGATGVIRNLVLRASFTKTVDPASVSLGLPAGTFRVTDSLGAEVPGVQNTTGRRISFVPAAACGPNPCGAANCFAQGDYTLTLLDGAAGILDIGGTVLTCDLAHPCSISFNVGDVIDCENPEVTLDFTQVCVSPANNLYAEASDDSGVDNIEFFADGVSVNDPGNPVVNPNIMVNNPFNTVSLGLPVIWDASSYTVGAVVTIRATAEDMDSHLGSDNGSYRLRPAHCCNGLLDTLNGEEGVDCGGPCAACVGAACGLSLADSCGGNPDPNCENTNCASGFCNCGTYPDGPDPDDSCQEKGYGAAVGDDCCVCELSPRIDWVSPAGGFCDGSINTPCSDGADCTAFVPTTCNLTDPNGAIGNLVTIGGRYFGDLPGTVTINGVSANLASSINPACTNSWSDTQIIVVVPPGVSDGPVRVTEGVTGSNYFDETGYDFIFNTIERPGLCLITPDNGFLDTPVTYEGVRLLNGDAFFGNYAANIAGLNPVFPINTQGSAAVANIATGRTTTFVTNPVGINGNYLRFRKLAETSAGPQITSFEPQIGAPGQYVTIYGSGFGRSKGLSEVHFGDELGPEAGYDFPEICAGSVWTDNYVIIKVPSSPSLADGFYTLTMVLPTGIIDTSALVPDEFEADAASPLLPSACKIEPILAPNNSPVSLWGEYFGAAGTGQVRFQLNRTVGPGLPGITFWGIDSDADKVTALVEQYAVSGPVRVVQGSAGNSLNLRVGLCTEASNPDEACGAQFCCPSGSYQAGRCVNDIDAECYLDVDNSVYEWGFSTEFGGGGIGDPCDENPLASLCQASTTMCMVGLDCDPTSCTCVAPGVNSCSGYSLTQCIDTNICPNSPGNCSVYGGGGTEVLGTCQFNCEGEGSCTAGTCTYNNSLDRCIENASICDLNRTVPDILHNNVPAYCADYGGTNRWHINTPLSCPPGFIMLPGGRCVDMTSPSCTVCNSGFTCIDDYDMDLEGLCSSGGDICPSDSACTAANNCERADSAICECCCRAPGSGTYDAQDCCAPLSCQGNCGSDASPGPDVDAFGYCSGCRVESAPGVVDQVASNNSCNCSGHSGKYCDAEVDVDGDGTKDGVCRDCAQLATTALCDNLGVGTCCFDAKDSLDVCRGTNGQVILGGGFCGYYQCDLNDPLTCDTPNPIPDAEYKTITACDAGCANNATSTGLGLSCSPYLSSGGTATTTCNTSICTGIFSCLNEDNTGPSYPDNCGFCCCDPNNDQCNVLNPSFPSLICKPDQSPCSGAGRGLCCGCEIDDNCGNPTSIGCGTDACCHARANVLSPYPADNAVDICRNTLIEVTFDGLMDISSFSGNIIVAGDYGTAPCPTGMEYLVRDDFKGKNVLARAFNYIVGGLVKLFEPVLPSRFASAYTFPTAGHNYCAVKGSVSGYHDVSGVSVLSFASNALLGGGILHYVIVEGDEILTDESTGVLNLYGVGINGPHDTNNTFNGVSYENSYIFSFMTLSEQAENNGVCEIAEVKILPDSYLFQTNKNDSLENDTDPLNISFDTKKDGDKVFKSYAYSYDEQLLNPLPGLYSWTWAWSVTPSSLASVDLGVLNGSAGDRSLIRVATNITEGKGVVNAIATIDAPSVIPTSPAGTTYPGGANIWLFICENPWPPLVLGTWSPWIDTGGNCTLTLAGCHDTNYEIYYCRDTGRIGTKDDLPSILSGSTVIRGEFGPADNRILKEAYFLRENLPADTTTVSATDDGTGGSVTVSWPPSIDPVSGYRVYWGRRSESYDNYVDATSPHTVTGLNNNQIYYFNVTSLYATGAESDWFGEAVAKPTDSVGPGNVANFTATPYNNEARLTWDAVADAKSYQIYYGTAAGSYGFTDNVGTDHDVFIAGLSNGIRYYFAVVARDEYGNSSNATGTDTAMPFAAPLNLIAAASSTDNTVIELKWDLESDGVATTRVYWGPDTSVYTGPGSPISLPGTQTSFSIDSLSPGQDYYFVIRTVNTDGDESKKSNEAKGITSP